LPRST
jgi:IS5 family transposase